MTRSGAGCACREPASAATGLPVVQGDANARFERRSTLDLMDRRTLTLRATSDLRRDAFAAGGVPLAELAASVCSDVEDVATLAARNVSAAWRTLAASGARTAQELTRLSVLGARSRLRVAGFNPLTDADQPLEVFGVDVDIPWSWHRPVFTLEVGLLCDAGLLAGWPEPDDLRLSSVLDVAALERCEAFEPVRAAARIAAQPDVPACQRLVEQVMASGLELLGSDGRPLAAPAASLLVQQQTGRTLARRAGRAVISARAGGLRHEETSRSA